MPREAANCDVLATVLWKVQVRCKWLGSIFVLYFFLSTNRSFSRKRSARNTNPSVPSDEALMLEYQLRDPLTGRC